MRFKERHQASRTVISYVESEKSGHCEAHQEHQPVCEIQIKKSTVVRDARLHGTFYILMGPTTDAAVRANLLRSEVKSLRLQYKKQNLGVLSLSAGVAAFPEHASASDELLQIADQCLYESKARGRDVVTVASLKTV